MRKVLFIGGPANISSHTAKALLDKGYQVGIYTRSLSRDDYQLADRVKVYLGDRMDGKALQSALEDFGPEAVIDFCCFSPTQLKPVLHVLPADLEQYIFISTVDVYGYPLSEVPMPEHSAKNAPNCRYAADKRACETLLRRSTISEKTTIVRPAYSMGPRFVLTALSRNGGSTLIPKLRAGLPLISPDDGRGFLHAGTAWDAGRMIAELTLVHKAYGQDYTVAAEQATAYDDYIAQFAAALGVMPRMVHIPTRDIYRLADYTIYEENLLYDLTSHNVAFSVDKFKEDCPEFRWEYPLSSAIPEYIAYQDKKGGFSNDLDDLESLIIRRWQAEKNDRF